MNKKKKQSHYLDLGHKALFALVASLAISSIIFFNGELTNTTGAATGSGDVGISNAIISIFLNSTDPTLNTTNQNLTTHITSNSNLNIINWYLNDSSITTLNVPFEKVNDTTTSNYYDYSPNHYSFTENGSPVWNATGGFDGNGSYEFDGVNDYLRLASIPNRPSSQLTVCSWVKTSNLGSRSIIFTISRNPSVIENEGLFLINESGNLLFWDYNGIAYGFEDSSGFGGSNVANGQWNHVCFVKDGTSGTYYVNGEQDGTKTALNDVQYGSTDFVIGADYRDSDFYFDGTIDQFELFNISLTNNQIQAMYNNQSIIHSNQTSLNDSWKFCATPNNNDYDGITSCSNTISIISTTTPEITSVIINSTTPTINSTNDNLTSHINVTDSSGSVKLIYDWKVNGSSIAPLILPMEKINSTNNVNTKDYSENSIIVSEENGVLWNATGGFDGNGSYEFDGVDDYLNVSNDEPVNISGPITIMLWMTTHEDIDVTASWGMQMIGRGTYGDPDNTMDLRIRAANDEAIFNYEYGSGTNENYAIATTKLTDGNWHHVAATFTGSRCLIYTDGQLEGNVSCSNTPGPFNESWLIGKSLQTDNTQVNFSGSIDEVYIFNRSLSTDQIQAIYENRSDLIVSQETDEADNWTLCATANDGNVDSPSVCSTILEVNDIPSIPLLFAPTNNSARTNRSVNFIWNNSVDLNSEDTTTYQLQISNQTDFGDIVFDQSDINENTSTDSNYTYFPDLDVDTSYYWKIRATDGKETSLWSTFYEFDVLSSNVISLPTSSINFGEINDTADKNTTDGSGLQPIILSNDGNIPLNISINTTQMVSSQNSLWQCMIEQNETGAYLDANETWFNFTVDDNATTHIWSLYHENASNTANRANIHSLIYAASDESGGSKSSTIYVISEASE